MKNKLSLILCLPAYLIAVIFASIFTIFCSPLTALLDGAYFNPFRFKWMYFDGKDYRLNANDSRFDIFSLILPFFSGIVVLSFLPLIINCFNLIIPVILVIVVIKATRYFVNEVFKK